jgi:GTP-binding protein EngB required for normal cell division
MNLTIVLEGLQEDLQSLGDLGDERSAQIARRLGEALGSNLRLKLLADAALVGLPNAGKSSLLTRISNAKPKVAEYPFTTLAPILGTVDAPDASRQLTVADVPGLIEGASEGVGLGHEFLAHLERANLLLHVIDSSEDDAAERFATIDRELGAYGAGLETRPQAIVLNKIDLRADPPAFDVDDERIVRVFRVSCATGAGIEDLRRALFELCRPQALPAPSEDGLVDFLVYRPKPGGRRFRVLRTDRGFRISGEVPADEQELALALEAAGAFSVVLEGIPRDLAAAVTAALSIPTIGIGAGPDCDGQVLVVYDLLGMTCGPMPKFVKPYAHLGEAIVAAARAFATEVADGSYPDDAHSYH